MARPLRRNRLRNRSTDLLLQGAKAVVQHLLEYLDILLVVCRLLLDAWAQCVRVACFAQMLLVEKVSDQRIALKMPFSESMSSRDC